MSRFAAQTTVSPERSRAEIEALLRKYGADQFSSGWREGEARIQFAAHGRFVRFVLRMPDPQDKAFTQHPRYKYLKRSPEAARKAYEHAVRQRWRALCLVVKAKLEAVESGIESFEEAFLPHLIMPNGQTVAEMALPAIAAAYESGQMRPLLEGW